eukprot:g5752.t1
MRFTRCGVTATIGGQEVRVGTSRFLSQGPFLLYKSVMAVFFMSWAIYWREAGATVVLAKLTHQTWYIGMLYYFVSAASAYLCWRAIDDGSAGRAEGTVEDGKAGGDLTSQSNSNNADGEPATATTNHPGTPVPLALRRLQLVLWNIACVVSLIVVALFWFADYDGGAITSIDILAHVVIGPVLLIDQFLVADEFKLRHVVFSQMYGVFYIVFNIIWYYFGWREKLLYEVLDWDNKPLVACIYGAVCILILCPLFSLVHLVVYRRRERLHNHLQEKLMATRRGQS